MSIFRRHWVLCLILLVAGFLRFNELGKLPSGLFMDEAADGVEAAYTAAHHDYRVFYRSDNGREGLYIFLTSFAVELFGQTPFAVRFWAAMAGLMTCIALYFLARQWFGNRTALIAIWLLTTSFWHLNFSRLAFRGILLPLFLVLTIILLELAWSADDKRAILVSAAAGTTFGLGFYTYIPFRVVPILVLAFFLSKSWDERENWKNKLRSTLPAFSIAASIVLLPFFIYFVKNPVAVMVRTSQVALWSGPRPLQLLLRNVIRCAWMFVGKGDNNWRANLPPFPELIYPVGLFFVVGCVVIWRSRTQKHQARMIFAWITVMLIPALLTRGGVPHALRSIGSLPAAIFLAAVGFSWMLEQSRNRRTILFATAVLILAGCADCYRYFVIWRQAPEVAQAFQASQNYAAKQATLIPDEIPVIVAFEVQPESSDIYWDPEYYMRVNPDRSRIVVPVPVPLFHIGQRNNTYFVPLSSLTSEFLQNRGCSGEAMQLQNSISRGQPNSLILLSGCSAKVVLFKVS